LSLTPPAPLLAGAATELLAAGGAGGASSALSPDAALDRLASISIIALRGSAATALGGAGTEEEEEEEVSELVVPLPLSDVLR
jgi:hypothetical protein